MELGLNKISALILAAGSSSRMGRSKQLLPVRGEALLLRTIKTALTSGLQNVMVVVGANSEAHLRAILDSQLPVQTFTNTVWHEGMGSSLKAGLNFLTSGTEAPEGVIVLVCDQPLLSSDHLRSLVHAHALTRKPIVASTYADTFGVPAFFAASLFDDLKALHHEHGAKKVIQNHLADTAFVPFPPGEIDLDTPEDYDRFISNF